MTDLPGVPPPLDRRPRGLLGRAGEAHPLGQAVHEGARLLEAAVRPVVRRRRDQPVPQRGRPPPRGARRSEGAGLDLHRSRQDAVVHLPGAHGEVNRVAAMMQSLGVSSGDRVIIYMPNIPEAVFAILACARIGAVHSVVFGGFAAASLAARIDDARPALMITADAGSRMGKVVRYKPLVDESIRLAQASAGEGADLQPRPGPGHAAGEGPGCGLEGALGQVARRERRLRLARIERAFLHPLHLRHDRQAEGRAARRRRPCRGAGRVDEAHLSAASRARRCSPPPTSAGRWGTPTSSTARSSRA